MIVLLSVMLFYGALASIAAFFFFGRRQRRMSMGRLARLSNKELALEFERLVRCHEIYGEGPHTKRLNVARAELLRRLDDKEDEHGK